MRKLIFDVKAQSIEKNKACDFSGLVKGTTGYLKAKFNLSPEWTGCKVAASFWCLGKEYPAILDSRKECIIPDEALRWDDFSVSLTGMKEGYLITTDRVKVEQKGA